MLECTYPDSCAIKGLSSVAKAVCASCLGESPEEQCFRLTYLDGSNEVVNVGHLVEIDISEAVRAITTYIYRPLGGYVQKISFDSLAEI